MSDTVVCKQENVSTLHIDGVV